MRRLDHQHAIVSCGEQRSDPVEGGAYSGQDADRTRGPAAARSRTTYRPAPLLNRPSGVDSSRYDTGRAMSDHPQAAITRIRLRNFTAFRELDFKPSPGDQRADRRQWYGQDPSDEGCLLGMPCEQDGRQSSPTSSSGSFSHRDAGSAALPDGSRDTRGAGHESSVARPRSISHSQVGHEFLGRLELLASRPGLKTPSIASTYR